MQRVTAAALFTSLLAPLAAQNEPLFEQGYAKVRELLQKEKWKDARTALDALLDANERKLWVLAEKETILEDCRRCAFAAEVALPKPQDLISGKVLSWSPSNNRIKLRYTPALMNDWERDEGERTLWVHPAAWKGEYQVAISGSLSTGQSVMMLFDIGSDARGIASFGGDGGGRTFFPMMVKKGQPGEEKVLFDDDRLPGLKSGPFNVTLKVGPGRVQMNLGDPKRAPVDVKGTGACGGQIGFIDVAFSEVVLEGTIEPSWLQSVADAWLAEKRAAFDAGYRPEKHLPGWLFETPPGTCAVPKFRHQVAGLETAKRTKVLETALGHMKKGEWLQMRASIEKSSDEDMPPVTRTFLDGLGLLRMGQPEAALPHLDAAVAADPQFTFSRVLRAETLESLRRMADAQAEYQQALAGDPGETLLYERTAVTMLMRGQLEPCRKLVREGKVQHGLWEAMRPLDQVLAMLERGPQWQKCYRYLTPNYDIASDIDARVCAQAGSLLEGSLANLKAQFLWLKDDKSQGRYSVFLFSGEAGYQEYCKKILGSPSPHTAGLYSPVLKQLLIWNLPKREDMDRTIRHEGFHQFLDRALVDPPVWFNEGLAEFWETARREKDRFTGGQVRNDHLATLTRSRGALPKLKDFAYGSAEDFYRNASLRYAQAWAFVHFLRKGPAPYQKVFQSVWESLRGDSSMRAALDKGFAGVDWSKIDSDFWAYVERLR